MEVVIADEQLAGKLPHLKKGAAIKSPNGRILGIFKPLPDAAAVTTGRECPFSDEELDAIEAESGFFTWDEIKAHLSMKPQNKQ